MTASERIRQARQRTQTTSEMRGSWSLVQLTPEAAEEHDRRTHNVPDGCGLGWKPYTYRATERAVAQFACHDERTLTVQLRVRGLRVKAWSDWRDGVRTARLVEA